MPAAIISTVSAPTSPIELVPVSDEAGRAYYIPRATFDFLRSKGAGSVAVTLSLAIQPARPWVTVAAASMLLMTDVDGLDRDAARHRVVRACERGEIVSEGSGRDRRIDPVSLDAWRLKQREQNLRDD